jgi:hypothetical protein
VINQALGLEAAEHLVNGAALDLQVLGQRQDREVLALGRCAEDDELGIAEAGHRRSPPSESTIALLRA